MKYIYKEDYNKYKSYTGIEFSLIFDGNIKVYKMLLKDFNLVFANSTHTIRELLIKLKNNVDLIEEEYKEVDDYFMMIIKERNLVLQIDELKLEDIKKRETIKRRTEVKRQKELKKQEKIKRRAVLERRVELRKQEKRKQQKALEKIIFSNEEIIEIIDNYILMNKKEIESNNFDFSQCHIEYELLYKLINEYVNIENKQVGILVVNKVIYKRIIKIYANIFKKEHEYINEIMNEISIKKMLEQYFKYYELDLLNTHKIFSLWSYLIDTEIIKNKTYEKFEEKVRQQYEEYKEDKKYQMFKHKIKQYNGENYQRYYTIDDIDLLSGHEFEKFIGNLFYEMGYIFQVTKASGDQGIDILIEKNGRKKGVQAKCYSNNVTNKAIQEVVAGLKYYNCDEGIVVTNNYFTKSAIELAKVNNVILWDRNTLKQKIDEVINKF